MSKTIESGTGDAVLWQEDLVVYDALLDRRARRERLWPWYVVVAWSLRHSPRGLPAVLKVDYRWTRPADAGLVT